MSATTTKARPDRVAYSIATAAVAADVSPKTIQRAIRSGGLRAKQVGRLVRIMRADLEAWLEGHPDAETT
jgi:excisionase family DNA binding protein